MSGTRLLLVRHGESQVQVDGIVGGAKGCTGLSELGRRQVDALRRRWERTPVEADVLVASTLPRAVETAQILAPALGDLPIEEDPGFTEIDPGESDAITWEEFTRLYRTEGWTFDPDRPMAPGGESWRRFQERVGRSIEALVTAHAGRTIVVACHGGVVDSSMAHFLDTPRTGWGRFRITNASVTEWVRSERGPGDDGNGVVWRLQRFNDAGHLEGLEASADHGG